MEKSAHVLIALLVAAILLSDNFLENTSDLDDRIAELEEDNSEKDLKKMLSFIGVKKSLKIWALGIL